MSGTTSQSDVIAFLTETLTRSGTPPKRITTHVSEVFLSGDRAFKLKRAVKFPFLDFTTLDARESACRRELVINRRTAPDIYLGVCAVTTGPDGLALDGKGVPVEWVIEMRRFDETTLFDRLAHEPGKLTRRLMETLADEIAAFHASAASDRQHGGHAGTRKIAENNIASFKALPDDIFDHEAVDSVTSETLTHIDRLKKILDGRRDQDRVRVCHGDLHLRNICLVDGRPTLFDAIEFSDDFSNIDILYDLAFLLMDLDACDHHRLASIVLNRYLDVSDEDTNALNILPVFQSMRAQIRAHVGAAAARAQESPDVCATERDRARQYLELAQGYLTATAPRLVAIGGLSGSGKSRLAREVAPGLGGARCVRVLRTDIIRKRLAGIHPNERLGADGYTAEMTQKTYTTFLDQAHALLVSGQSVVMDAVFARQEERAAAEHLAEDLHVPFQGIWVDAPEDIRVHRVEARRNNVSDAGADIARQQSAYDLGALSWPRVDSSGSKEQTLALGMDVLRPGEDMD